MPSIGRVLSTLLTSVIGITVMVIVATIVFYVTVFVVTTGSRIAGHDPSSDYVVLAASLLVVAVILTGGLTPRMAQERSGERPGEEPNDPTYD